MRNAAHIKKCRALHGTMESVCDGCGMWTDRPAQQLVTLRVNQQDAASVFGQNERTELNFCDECMDEVTSTVPAPEDSVIDTDKWDQLRDWQKWHLVMEFTGEEQITDLDDVRDWFVALTDFLGHQFHPDKNFRDYKGDVGHQFLHDDDARALNSAMNVCRELAVSPLTAYMPEQPKPEQPKGAKPYTVLLLYPLDGNDVETYHCHVTAKNVRGAIAQAVADCKKQSDGWGNADNLLPLAVYDGFHVNYCPSPFVEEQLP
jgi:hypothetical protein